MKRGIIIFSGYNQRAVIAFIRTLENNNCLYAVIARDASDTIFYTLYANHVVAIREEKNLEVKYILGLLCEVKESLGYEEVLIAPSTEYLNRFLVNNKNMFEKNGFIIPLVNKELYCKISNKASFKDLCNQNNIKTPKTYLTPKKIEYPVVIKPKKYASSDNCIYSPILVNDEFELARYLKGKIEDDFFAEQYINGGISYYLLFYITKEGAVYKYSQENLCQQNGGKSIVIAMGAEYHKDSEIVSKYEKMLLAEKFHGLIMIEVRRKNDIDYMIEANPRFWGPSQLFVDANKNFFNCLLKDYGFLDLISCFNYIEKKAFYFWSSALIENEIKWYNEGKSIFNTNKDMIENNNLYDREDTKKLFFVERMGQLYKETSKHSNYQILPDAIAELLNVSYDNIKHTYEKERLEFICKYINIDGQSVTDIGGNIGYFTFEAISKGAKKVKYFEGNKSHAEFVEIATSVLGLKNKITVYNNYYDFSKPQKKTDVLFCLNVLHHFGDDFGNVEDVEIAKKEIINAINNLSKNANYLVLQLGFNWMGNRNKGLFEKGTKREMIDFIQEGCSVSWNIKTIGIAEKDIEGRVTYKELNKTNVERVESYGEFLNRPIFILEAKRIKVR